MRRPPVDRRALRARRQALRAKLRGRERRRRWPWLLLLLLLLLCLIPIPSCEEAQGPAEVAEVEVRAGEPAPPVEPQPAAAPVPRLSRPSYAPPPPDPVPWLEAWRVQVAARGPRLATCFEGATHPGALRWSTRVEPAAGRVSDHVLEPVLDTAPLTAAQRACVLAVLTDPPYRLDPAEPARAGLVIEF